MICQRCQRSLRSSEGLKCSVCDSKFHLKCISDSNKDLRDSGDRGYQWKCAICHSSTNKITEPSKENLINALNIITEKFEIVNKVHLPQISNDLTEIKSITDRIVKQNADLLRKIDEFEKRKACEKKLTQSYRKRNFNLIQGSKKAVDKKDYVPLASTTTPTTARFHTRRRSYLLNSMFHLLKRKSNRPTVSTPRKR